MARVVKSIDEPLDASMIVRRRRLEDGTEIEVPMSDEERAELWRRLTEDC